MSAAMVHFVCDRCGNIWKAHRSRQCPACGHGALRQFATAREARDIRARLADPNQTVPPLTLKETNEHGS